MESQTSQENISEIIFKFTKVSVVFFKDIVSCCGNLRLTSLIFKHAKRYPIQVEAQEYAYDAIEFTKILLLSVLQVGRRIEGVKIMDNKLCNLCTCRTFKCLILTNNRAGFLISGFFFKSKSTLYFQLILQKDLLNVVFALFLVLFYCAGHPQTSGLLRQHIH